MSTVHLLESVCSVSVVVFVVSAYGPLVSGFGDEVKSNPKEHNATYVANDNILSLSNNKDGWMDIGTGVLTHPCLCCVAFGMRCLAAGAGHVR